MGIQWPNTPNKSGETRFRFACVDEDCKGHKTFHINYYEAPDIVPSSVECPFDGDHMAEWCVPGLAEFNIRGNARGVENPHYSKSLADSEHKWMELQIEEAKKAISGEDQITGKAASPYAKRTLNVEKALEAGVIKKIDENAAAEKKRIASERAKVVAEKAKEHITREIDQKHVGRRHDG